ncbi:endolytic transglycosylase MltG [Candidatus Uhrbacteria bacterium]|nr:endolytic transglycosylase MltG [Candidatus Uhrbacteria bacterium]
MKRPLSIALAVAAVSSGIAWYGVYLSTPGRPSGPFVINPGDGTDRIVAGLEDAGVVRSGVLFKLALSSSELATKLQPGSYDLADAKSYRQLIERLASGGAAANEVTVRILEGWTVREIADHLAAKGLAKDAAQVFAVVGEPAEDFRTSKKPTADFSSEFDFFADKPINAGLEGYLFPDTYRVFADATVEDVVRTMLANFGRKLDTGLRTEITAAGRSIRDVIIMASVIEREVRSEEDRAMVSDIFWRRLKIGMAMQADSTVNYATNKGLPSVTHADTQLDSPYNTYKYPGLPLGPIGNPGLSAIKAAIEPKKNDFWYFLTDPEGNVHYGRNIEEHNRNKAKYLR